MIIILNGPPGSGKDTIADYFVEHHDEYISDSFKSALYGETASYFGLQLCDLVARNEDRNLKDVPYYKTNWDKLISPRGALIHTSEKVIKPHHGKDHFGKLKGTEWARMLADGASCIISDGGFPEETNAVCDKVGFENVVIMRLYREGYDFSGDSRRYIKSSESKCKVVDIHLIKDEVGRACSEIYGAVLSL